MTAEHRAGAALRRLTTAGLSLRDIAFRCGLSVSAVRRLLRLTPPAQALEDPDPSTSTPRGDAIDAHSGDGPGSAGVGRR
jgi:hypothetical protein